MKATREQIDSAVARLRSEGLCGAEGTDQICALLAGHTGRHGWEDEALSVEEAIARLLEAVLDEGPAPGYHREIMGRHRREWPTLWEAIDALVVLPPSDTKETQ